MREVVYCMSGSKFWIAKSQTATWNTFNAPGEVLQMLGVIHEWMGHDIGVQTQNGRIVTNLG